MVNLKSDLWMDTAYCDGTRIYGTSFEVLEEMRERLNPDRKFEKMNGIVSFKVNPNEARRAELLGAAMVNSGYIARLMRQEKLV